MNPKNELEMAMDILLSYIKKDIPFDFFKAENQNVSS